MPCCDGNRRFCDLACPYGDNAAVRRGKRKDADTVKEAAEPKCGHGLVPCGHNLCRYSASGISRGYGTGSHNVRLGLNLPRSRGKCDNTWASPFISVSAWTCWAAVWKGEQRVSGIKITALSVLFDKVSGVCFAPVYRNGKSRSLFPKAGLPIRFLIYTFDVLGVGCRPVLHQNS